MLLLLALLVPLVTCQRATTPATPFFPFEGITDPSKQCLDIFCYSPIEWSDNKREVCRFRKNSTCEPRTKEVCIDVPVTECEVVGYTECDTRDNPQQLRDDQVLGEFFNEQICETKPITVTEMKMKPECFNMTKNVCEKMWVKDAPFWKDVNCQELVWENCTMMPHPREVTIDYCNCKPTEIWYNKFEQVESDVSCISSSCVPKAVPVCRTVQQEKCTTVEWEECTETCSNECSEQHFQEPSQEHDHRRWCSHVEIIIPPGVTRPHAPSGETGEVAPIPRAARAFTPQFRKPQEELKKPLPHSRTKRRPADHESRGA